MSFTSLPIEVIENIKLNSNLITGEFNCPIATFETTLFKSIKRGALLSRNTAGIFVSIEKKIMTRSILLEFDSLHSSLLAKNQIDDSLCLNFHEISLKTSKYCKFSSYHIEIIGSLMFLRLSFFTDEAAGHNMTTKVSDDIGIFLKNTLNCNFISVSANFCVDKKNSSINGILGRGIHANAEIVVTKDICQKILKSSPEKIEKIVYYKNYIGSAVSGSLRSANAHFANIIAGFYLATGQDVANIVEGSQGFTFAKINESGDLIFSISIPNLILGSIGNGKHFDFVQYNISKMNLDSENLSEKFAVILSAAVLCGEISLLASLTNEGDLINGHIKYERRH